MTINPTANATARQAGRDAASLPLAGHPPASIVVVSYNSLQHLERCLGSLGATLYDGCEVIVVDNASSDGSARYVEEQYPWVRLVRLSRNEGFAAANNRGVELARHPYVVALNPDTEAAPGWLSALLAPFARYEPGAAPVGMTTARILMMQEPDRVNTCGNSMHITGITVCRGLGQRSDHPALSSSCDINAVSGACFAMPRRLWLELGGLDPDFFTYVEDTDLSLRVRLAGYRCVYAPGGVVYHNYSATFPALKLYYLERNRALMLLKCLRGSTLFFMLPILGLAEMVAWGYALKSGPSHMRSKLRAYGWLVANARLIKSKRRQMRRSRRVGDRHLLSGVEWRLDIEQLAGPAVACLAGGILNPLFRLWHLAATSGARGTTLIAPAQGV